MFMQYYDRLNQTQQAIFLLVVGFLLLAFQQQWFFLGGLRAVIDWGLLLLALICIGYGFHKLEWDKKILALIDDKKKSRK